MSVANQKVVQIAPRTKRDSQHLYAMINIDALQVAVQDLKGSALKMWLYFSKNQDGYKFELSQKACFEWGIKKDSYYEGIRELIAKGYLVPVYQGSNVYCFYEKAKTDKPKDFSETENPLSTKQKTMSDFPQRNNTNNTEIKQNRTIGASCFDEPFEDTSFAVGERGACDKVASEQTDDYVNSLIGRFSKGATCENPNILIDKYF